MHTASPIQVSRRGFRRAPLALDINLSSCYSCSSLIVKE
jgi:hypothetical protein